MTSLREMRRFVRCAPVFVLNQIRIWMKYSNRFCVSKWSLKVEREIKAPTSMNVSLAWKLFSSVLFFMQKISSKSRNFNSIFSWRTFPWETKTVWFKILTGGSEASIKKLFSVNKRKSFPPSVFSLLTVLDIHPSGQIVKMLFYVFKEFQISLSRSPSPASSGLFPFVNVSSYSATERQIRFLRFIEAGKRRVIKSLT